MGESLIPLVFFTAPCLTLDSKKHPRTGLFAFAGCRKSSQFLCLLVYQLIQKHHEENSIKKNPEKLASINTKNIQTELPRQHEQRPVVCWYSKHTWVYFFGFCTLEYHKQKDKLRLQCPCGENKRAESLLFKQEAQNKATLSYGDTGTFNKDFFVWGKRQRRQSLAR